MNKGKNAPPVRTAGGVVFGMTDYILYRRFLCPHFVNPNACNACAGEHQGPLCVYICPNDLMALDTDANKGFNQEPQLCSECYACVKLCPQEAIEVRGYADFIPLGASVQPRRVEGGLTWTVTFRNGKVLEFTYPSRSTPVGLQRALQGLHRRPCG